MFKADGAGGHHDVPGLNVQIDAAAGAGTNEGVRAALVELLHGNGPRKVRRCPVEQAVTFSPSSVPVQTLNSRL